MIEDQVTFRSSVKPLILRKNLFRGTFFSLIAFLLLFFLYQGGKEGPLASWGALVFLVSLALMAYGFIPFRKLSSLLTSPSKIVCTPTKLTFFDKGCAKMEVPYDLVDRLAFIESSNLYGITLKLKEEEELKVKLLEKAPRLKEEIAWNLLNYQAEIFFPFFDQATAKEIKDLIEASREV